MRPSGQQLSLGGQLQEDIDGNKGPHPWELERRQKDGGGDPALWRECEHRDVIADQQLQGRENQLSL